MDINNVVLVGRLTRDAEIKTTQKGTGLLAFSLAVNGWDGTKEEPNFFDVTCFCKTEEHTKKLGGMMTKGQRIGITGSLKQDKWQDKESGKPRSRVVVHTWNVQLLSGKADSPEEAPAQAASEDDNEVPF